MARRRRSDMLVGNFEEEEGIGNSLTNPDSGRNTRSDKLLGNHRKDWEDYQDQQNADR